MKKTRIRRIIVRESEMTIVKTHGIENEIIETETQICPVCHSPIHLKQVTTASDRKLLPEESDSKKEKI